MFAKVLVANRGEIAVRVLQSCAELGIRGVAVYSDADRSALHVRRADESYHLGAAPATSSYLDIERVIAAARRSGAEAIHPGYGFLAENPLFAEACGAAGIVFVGPSPAAMRLLGDKRAAKALARRVGVPVVPGYDGEAQGADDLAEEARRLGFPLLIKAAAGGGGRGMRVVRSAAAFAEALEGARREAQAAFGDDTVLLERYVESPRHIEFQALADGHGGIVHLGERECSVQRRHQKVIEESPSTALTTALREEMGAAAVALLRAADYLGAGTVEFLFAPSGQYHFLEVNTRLQVEHPVTELVTGLDLVREQLRIAAGLPLAIGQDDVHLRGHAIECRVYAEDPRAGFLPSTGPLLLFEPPAGIGIRNDVGVETGDGVGPYYDPLLAKLIAQAPDRPSCIARARAALRAYTVLGVTTNLPLLGAVLDSPGFRRGEFATDSLDRQFSTFIAVDEALPERALLAAAGWQLTAPEGGGRDPWRAGPWRVAGQGLVLRYRHAGEEFALSANRQGADSNLWAIGLPAGGRVVAIERVGASTLLVREGAQLWGARVVEVAGALQIGLDGQAFALQQVRGLSVDELGRAAAVGQAPNTLLAPMPGLVAKVRARVGERVGAGETLLVIEAMKMEHIIAAPHGGTVRRLPYAVGDLVQAGTVLAEVEE